MTFGELGAIRLTFFDFLDIVLQTIVPPTQRVVLEVQLHQTNQPARTQTNLNTGTRHREPSEQILHEERYLDRLLKVAHRHGVDCETGLQQCISLSGGRQASLNAAV